jgi:hypothetical protein
LPEPATNSPITTGNYRVMAGSPSIDTGLNGTISITEEDVMGNLRRFNGGTVDMGAYEYQGVATSGVLISVKTGNWESADTWNLNRVPLSTDNVIIDQNHTVSITTDTASARNIEYRQNAILNFANSLAKLNLSGM